MSEYYYDNSDLLSNVFDAAYDAMVGARGTLHTECSEFYVDVDRIVETAKAGAESARREMMDKCRMTCPISKRDKSE